MANKIIEHLKKEMQVKDKVIIALVHICAENKITLPVYLTAIIETLYKKKIKKEEIKSEKN